MIPQALSTLPREAKGPLAAPPALHGPLQAVVDAVSGWPGVQATTHWHFSSHKRVDGVDFYVGPDELGHLHLDGSIHLATPPDLGAELVVEGLGRPVRWGQGWAAARVARRGVAGAGGVLRPGPARARWGCSAATTTG